MSTWIQTDSSRDTFLLIDLGTTTVAFLLLDGCGVILDSLLISNPQTPYGSDIISRLQYANEGGLSFLSHLIRKQLRSSIEQLLNQNHIAPKNISHCYIGCNTGMVHLFMGYPCNELVVAPFIPYTKKVTTVLDFMVGDAVVNVTIFPCISGFIGGDLVAGIYSLDFESRKDTTLLIDCGTNGEIALLHKGKCYTASVAAGPAMEGGSLSCGGAGVPGAVTEVYLGGIAPRVRTIHNKLPVHICGTGAISCIAELLKHDYIDSSGLATKKFPHDALFLSKTMDGKGISFNIEDVRQMQLALGSIRAGYETLFSICKLDLEDVDYVYLSGGFGCEISLTSAFVCHLFPDVWEGKIQAIGNSCLAGLQKYVLKGGVEFLNHVVSDHTFIRTVSLAKSNVYRELFPKRMEFLAHNSKCRNSKL